MQGVDPVLTPAEPPCLAPLSLCSLGELPLRWDVDASLWNFSWSPRTPLHGMVIVTNYRIIFQPNDATQAFLDSGRAPTGPPWPRSSETDVRGPVRRLAVPPPTPRHAQSRRRAPCLHLHPVLGADLGNVRPTDGAPDLDPELRALPARKRRVVRDLYARMFRGAAHVRVLPT